MIAAIAPLVSVVVYTLTGLQVTNFVLERFVLPLKGIQEAEELHEVHLVLNEKELDQLLQGPAGALVRSGKNRAEAIGSLENPHDNADV